MVSVVVLGAGNVGIHLCRAVVRAKDLKLLQWYNRSPIQSSHSLKGVSFNTDLSQIPDADLYIIAVSDDAIESLSKQLSFTNRLVVHTSGSLSIRFLSNNNRRGVFYPLQSFSKSSELSFSQVPICIEANDKNDRELLKTVAEALGSPSYMISSEQRQTLHLAAVFVNNFTNQLYRLAHELTDEKSLDFELLKPLILETAKKVQTLSPYRAQTGPAKRNDKKTIKKHLKLLQEHPKFQDIYQILSTSIQNTHGKKKL